MSLSSPLLAGATIFDPVLAGRTALIMGSATNPPQAVKLVQTALVQLGYPLPVSFKAGVPDGRYGNETRTAVVAFQRTAFPKDSRQWDGQVGKLTLAELDNALRKKSSPGPAPGPAPDFVCGPDVSKEVADVWRRIQSEFRLRPRSDKIKLCNKILFPINEPGKLLKELLDSLLPGQLPKLEDLKAKIKLHADINGWDVLPLYQGNSQWLRLPPVYDDAVKGPFATPSSSDFSNSDPFAAGHESDATCSNTVQVNGKCWLNGSVNYGTFGIMVKECNEFAVNDLFLPNPLNKDPFDYPLKLNPVIRALYSLEWAKTLIRAYKRFGDNPEGAIVPIAWTEATFNGGPTASPAIAGNRPKCTCKPGLTGSIVKWDYVWEPVKPRTGSTSPM